MAKADQISTRFNILYILHILKNHSDKNHPISIAEITEYLEQDLEQYGIRLDRTTILRTITALEDDFIGHFQKGNLLKKGDAELMDFGPDFGFYVGRKKVMKESSQDKKKTKNNSIYKYYYESDLSEGELKTLYDAIETYNYFCADDLQNIAQKLCSIRPMSSDLLKYIPSQYDKKLKDDKKVFEHISELATIIKNQQLAKITYGYYNENLHFVTKSGYPKTLRPLHLIWSNGFYYCIMGIKKYDNTINLRVDRIKKITPLPATMQDLKEYSGFENIKGSNDLRSKSEYRMKNPIMYSGIQKRFHLLVNASTNNMMNTIMDVFGNIDDTFGLENKKTVPVSTDTAQKFHLKANGKGWVELRIKCAEPGMELFATEYCKDVIIVSPDASAQRVRETLKEALGHYGG